MGVDVDLAGQAHSGVLGLIVQIRRLIVEPRDAEAWRELPLGRRRLNTLVILINTFGRRFFLVNSAQHLLAVRRSHVILLFIDCHEFAGFPVSGTLLVPFGVIGLEHIGGSLDRVLLGCVVAEFGLCNFAVTRIFIPDSRGGHVGTVFVLADAFVDLVRVEVSVSVRIHLAVRLVLSAAHDAPVRHGRFESVEIVK